MPTIAYLASGCALLRAPRRGRPAAGHGRAAGPHRRSSTGGRRPNTTECGLTAAPAQHFSGRSLRDRNRTLWASWIIESGSQRIFYSGDSGYFDGFQQIGERFGGFDLTLIENGAYDAYWPSVHMTPEEGIRAFEDLRGKLLFVVHNSTFDLAFHTWHDPMDRIAELARTRRSSWRRR